MLDPFTLLCCKFAVGIFYCIGLIVDEAEILRLYDKQERINSTQYLRAKMGDTQG